MSEHKYRPPAVDQLMFFVMGLLSMCLILVSRSGSITPFDIMMLGGMMFMAWIVWRQM